MWVMRELQSWSPRGCLLQCPVLELAMRRSCVSRKVFGRFYPPVGGRMGGLKRHRPAVPCISTVIHAQETGKGENFNNLVIQTQVSTVLPAGFLARNLAITWISNQRRATGHRSPLTMEPWASRQGCRSDAVEGVLNRAEEPCERSQSSLKGAIIAYT